MSLYSPVTAAAEPPGHDTHQFTWLYEIMRTRHLRIAGIQERVKSIAHRPGSHLDSRGRLWATWSGIQGVESRCQLLGQWSEHSQAYREKRVAARLSARYAGSLGMWVASPCRAASRVPLLASSGLLRCVVGLPCCLGFSTGHYFTI